MFHTTSTVLSQATHWLVEQQDEDGGWGQAKGTHTNSLNTAEVILAMLDAGELAARKEIQDGIRYLCAHQTPESAGEEAGCWQRIGAPPTSIPDIIRTCFATQALIRAGFGPNTTNTSQAIKWLKGRQNSDGGWGFHRGSGTAFLPTCLTLRTLVLEFDLDSNHAPKKLISTISNGFDALLRFRHSDGSFGDPNLKIAHTTYAVFLLRDVLHDNAMNEELAAKALDGILQMAISWLSRSYSLATKMIEEEMPIDPNRHLNYKFRHMADAMLVEFFSGEVADAPVHKAALDHLIPSVVARREPSGGFCADRMSSWATAKVLSGLKAASQIRKVASDLNPGPAPLPIDRKLVWTLLSILTIIVFTLGSVIWLTASGKLDLLASGSMLILVLIAMVAAGFISQDHLMGLLTKILEMGIALQTNLAAKLHT